MGVTCHISIYFTTDYWGEPERAPQFGGSSSSSAMHHGRLYVRTRTFPAAVI